MIYLSKGGRCHDNPYYSKICLLPDGWAASPGHSRNWAISLRSRFAAGELEKFKELNTNEGFVGKFCDSALGFDLVRIHSGTRYEPF